MPKLKTKSSVKKRFSLTASGKVKANHSGKRHNLIKRTPKQIRQKRSRLYLCSSDADIVKQYLPYGRK